ncbi:COG4223 family protein [Methylocystis echinoides]|uniref:Uncharacterized protein n=1 Tax=Methylocystis echinoides TaxID=29468 RepID=A0A9W6GQV0_9HYPH|nr:hypothetical protein [Methylocystis echinoides]GLI91248.1 hypothetical protein LMG27198_02400 [Methylocystis echinoides]
MAAPQPEKSDQATKASSPATGGDGPKPGAAATPNASKPNAAKPVRRAGSLVSRLFFSLVILLMLLGVAGYGALLLRDTDPRIRVAADYVDEGVTQARGLIAGLTGAAPTAEPPRGGVRPTLEKAPLTPQEPGAEPEKSAEAPAPEAPAPDAPAKNAEAKNAEAEIAEAKPAEVKPDEPKAPEARPVEPKAAESKPAEPAPEVKPVEAAPPVAAAAPAPAPVAKAESRDADGFSDRDLINALEGRLDALSDELRGLREKLDAPKNETRAAPVAETPKPAASSDAAAAAVVLAFALQRELEAGRPYAAEIAAFARLGTEPAPAPVLVELAEKGAPTGPALREAFLPLAKKLRAHESHADSGALTDHLLQGASKLVKVRPTGEAQPETLDGKIDRLEAALGHNDFDAAARLFDSLPEEARTDAADFGARLRQRQEAAKAADELLSGVIAALGKK